MPCVNVSSGPLFIKYKGSDNGTRPIDPCGGPNPFWVSPSLWLEHPTDNSLDEASTKVGVATTLKVLVHNSGPLINNVNVEAFICDFTAGVSPASAIPGTGKFTGFVSSIAAGSVVSPVGATVTCTPIWTPTAAQLAINGGHVCMFANCFSDTDGQSVDSIAVDPVTHSLPFCCDSHLAQRNIRIVAASQGQGLKNIRFDMLVANPSLEFATTVTPRINRIVGAAAITKNERWMLQTSPLIQTVKINGANRFVLANQGQIFFTSRAAERKSALTPEDVVLIGRSRFRKFDTLFAVDQVGEARDLRIALEPRETKTVAVNLQLNEGEKVGSTHTFDVAQTTADGTVIGGVRVLVLVVP